MSSNKKSLTYLYIGIFILVIVVSSLTTVYISRGLSSSNSFSGNNEKGGTNSNTAPTRFGVFDGHENCVKAIHERVNGKVIGLVSDDRTAKYEIYNDTNQITFQGEIQPPETKFLSKQRSTYHASFKCSTSSSDNSVINLNIEQNK
jgi:hypothetical protein